MKGDFAAPICGKRKCAALIGLSGLMAVAAVVAVPMAVFAATTSTGTSSVSVTQGSISIGSTTAATITAPVGGRGNGILPYAAWSNSTGNGTAWHGSVAVSDLTYTGPWVQIAGSTTSIAPVTGTYTGTADGVEYTVTVTTSTTGTTHKTGYKWASTYPNTTNNSGATGLTATAGTPVTIGTKGVQIEFASGTTYPAGAEYEIKVGTQPTTAFQLDNTASGAGITATTGTTSAPPVLENSGATLSGGASVGLTRYGTAVNFLSAAQGTAMGSYTVKPGVSVALDPQTWAATYKAGVQYTIATGP